jgi:hypothetical protein
MIKATKEAARYTAQGSEREHCSICQYYIYNGSACKKIEGRVSPDGWCRFFEAVPNRKNPLGRR